MAASRHYVIGRKDASDLTSRLPAEVQEELAYPCFPPAPEGYPDGAVGAPSWLMHLLVHPLLEWQPDTLRLPIISLELDSPTMYSHVTYHRKRTSAAKTHA